MIKILKDELNIKLIIPKIYENYFDKNLLYKTVDINGWYNNKIEKITNKLSEIRIIKKIIKDSNLDNIWFINTDFWIFFTLTFTNIRNKKIYITNYADYDKYTTIKDKVKNYFYRKSLKKIYKIIVSNKFKADNKNFYIPDYYYDDRYKKYMSEKRNKRVVVLGSIREDKDIIGTVKSFNKNNIPLLIKGIFTSDSMLKYVNSIAEPNISIINKYPEYDEYYSLLSSSEFCLLPYMNWSYENRSSGVILEALFLETIIIAPRFLLKFTGIKGIGYNDIEELENLKLENIKDEINDIRKQNELFIKEYDISKIQKKYLDVLLN